MCRSAKDKLGKFIHKQRNSYFSQGNFIFNYVMQWIFDTSTEFKEGLDMMQIRSIILVVLHTESFYTFSVKNW